MHIDFQDQSLFNQKVQSTINAIVTATHMLHKHCSIEEALKNPLSGLIEDLNQYYLAQRKKDYNQDQAYKRAIEVYSGFLQYLVCLAYSKGKKEEACLLTRYLMQDTNFFYYSNNLHRNSTVIIWKDFKQGTSVLSTLIQQGDVENIDILFNTCSAACGKDLVALQPLLNSDQDASSPLILACRAGHTAVVLMLLIKGERIFKRYSNKYAEFLSKKNLDGLSALHAAIAEDYVDIVDFLLKSAESNLTYSQYENFRHITNENGLFPIEVAITRNRKTILRFLLSSAQKMLSHQLDGDQKLLDQYHLALNKACQEQCVDILEDLLLQGEELFGTESAPKLSIRRNAAHFF